MAETVTIIDYGSGNLRSVQKALERAAREAGLEMEVVISSDAETIARADRIVLPGVGAFRACFHGLSALPGMLEALEDVVRRRGRPFLGVCVGMQLLASRGHEYGLSEGLGWIAGDVRPLADLPGVEAEALRVPHMGWNDVEFAEVGGFGGDRHEAYYFAHSYYFDAENAADVIASATYGARIATGLKKDNILGFQFHPEKSQRAGIDLLAAFLGWRP
ncbi:MAG: imidazole glycerol phosphate synthase subunit HisH [Pseudomonadota bacterium]